MGGTNHPRYELMEKIRPDLVLTANRASPVMLNELVARHFNVICLSPENWEDVLRNVQLLGWLLDAKAPAQQFGERLQADVERLQRIARELPATPTLYVETHTKPASYAPDWVREMAEFAGALDTYADRREDPADRRIVDIDDLQRRDPDAIVLAWAGADGDHDWEKVLDRPGWEDLRAVREERIFDVDARHVLHPGSALFYGLDDFTAIVSDVANAVSGEEPF
jgi:iron complex transport system substrate-binding protein